MATSAALRAVISAVDRVTGPLSKINKVIGQHIKAWGDVGRATAGLGGSVAQALGPLSAAAGALGLAGSGFGVGKIVETSAQFEKFSAILETVEGSAAKAKAGMAWVSDFAAKTPYQLAEVTDSFVKLKAYGIDPQKGALRSAGDAAAALGKQLNDAVEALADAMTGENERLKEFGIVANTEGNKITYSWVENGKQMTASANKNNKAQLQAVVTGIWNRKYQGAMDKLSKTWDGMWSNLQDTVSRFMVAIGDAGFFDAIKGELKALGDLINQWEADGTLKAVATEISGALVGALKGLKDNLVAIDWRGLADGAKRSWAELSRIVEAVGGWKNAVIGLFVLLNTGVMVAAAQIVAALGRVALVMAATAAKVVAAGVRMGVGLLIATGPIGIVIAAIGALAGSAYLLYQNWDKVVSWASSLWEQIKAIWQAGVSFVTSLISGDIAGAIVGLIDLGKSVLGALKTLFAPILDLMGISIPSIKVPETVSQTVSAVSAGAVSKAVVGAANDNVSQAVSGATKGNVSQAVSGAVAANSNVAPPPVPAASGGPATPASAPSPALAATLVKVEVMGRIDVRFADAPPGLRVDAGPTNHPGLSLNPDVGYRTVATGVR
ncbi:tape measure protein [Magnetospirillum molischianum]|uniref:Tape measure protein N-terminal domain-containing protein n=1 Tax=Magnetospirillum molischianum DSM 120 TaxID=1150626 RepID=H8FV00_MAGML|nr:tape measure protein [Magnetospirillum molischianum]CCG42188.1 hypothetical protein PHAMO_340061 [Magnetospirillum molischianum DSM 120]